MAKQPKAPLDVQEDWFKRVINEKFGSARNFARFLGIDPSALNLTLKSKRDVRVREAFALAEGLGYPVTEILLRLGVPIRHGAETAPIVGTVADDGLVTAAKSGVVTAPDGLPDTTIAIRNDDPRSFRYGWTYFVEPRSDVPKEAIGKLCVVRLPNGHQRLRFVKLSPIRVDQYTLLTENGDKTGDVSLETASPVLWIKS
jgi:DNA-binding transcriptional regulator YdaS (Cro superfamily)